MVCARVLALLVANFLVKPQARGQNLFRATPSTAAIYDPDVDAPTLSDADTTTVVVFVDPRRPLGPQSLSLAHALHRWFRATPKHEAAAPSGMLDSHSARDRGVAMVRILVGDCFSHPGLPGTWGLLRLPAIRVFPAGVDGIHMVNVPFDPSYRLENYTRRIEQLHAAAVDVHGDAQHILKPAGAILGQLSRVHAMALSAEQHSNEQNLDQGSLAGSPNTTAARHGLEELAKRLQADAQHVAVQLRARVKRMEMITQLLDQVSQGVDVSSLAQDLTDSVGNLMRPAFAPLDAPERNQGRETLLMWASTLRMLLQPQLTRRETTALLPEMLDEHAGAADAALDRFVNDLLFNGT